MKYHFKTIFNLGLIFFILSFLIFSFFLYLTIKCDTYIGLFHLIITILSFFLCLMTLPLAILIKKKNTLITNLKSYFSTIEKFNEVVIRLVNLEDVDLYEALFLKEKNLNEEYRLLGLELKKELIDHNMDASRIMNEWYNEPSLIKYYLKANYELILEMRKPFAKIPYELKKLKKE